MGPFGIGFGGGTGSPTIYEQEMTALLDAYSPGWDSDDSTQNAAEVRALALGTAMIWAVNKRLEGILMPPRMLETLGTWEDACKLRPLPGTTIMERRAALSARFLGFAGNTVSQIFDVAQALCGQLFLGVATVPESLTTNYEPGINPGPPGFEWCSNRCAIAIQLKKTGIAGADFFDLQRRLRNELNQLVPAWMVAINGTDESAFVAGVGVPGITLI